MKIPTLVNRGRNGFNMTPMIDVVFLLIIFFLVASHLSEQENQIQLDLPQAASATPLTATRNSRLTLNIPDTGLILIAGREIPFSNLVTTLQDFVARSDTEVEVRIRASRNLPYEKIDPVLAACATAGIWDISFAVFGRNQVTDPTGKASR